MTKLNDKIKLIEFVNEIRWSTTNSCYFFNRLHHLWIFDDRDKKDVSWGGPRRGCRIEILDRSANTDGPQVSDRLILRKLKLQRCRCAFRRTTCAAVKSANDGPFLPPLRVILVDWRGAIIRPRYRPRGSTARVGVLNDRYFFSLEKRPPRFVACLSCRASYLALIVPVATFSLCAATFMHR